MDILAIVFGLTTLAGVLLTILYGRKSARLEKSRKKLEWSDFQACATDLAAAVKRFFVPDLIVTPGLRGATLANLMIKDLGENIPVLVGASYWKEAPGPGSAPTGYFHIETNKWHVYIPEIAVADSSKRVLIVDDFTMSGDFLEKLVACFLSAGFERDNIKTATAVVTRIAIQNHKAPDIHWMESLDTSFYFPWGKAR